MFGRPKVERDTRIEGEERCGVRVFDLRRRSRRRCIRSGPYCRSKVSRLRAGGIERVDRIRNGVRTIQNFVFMSISTLVGLTLLSL